MAISDRPNWHNDDEEILAFQEDYPEIYEFVLKVLDGNCSDAILQAFEDEYGKDCLHYILNIISGKASEKDIEDFREEYGDEVYLPIKKMIEQKRAIKDVADKLQKDENTYIRYLRKDVPDVFGFVLQQIQGIHDEKAARKLVTDYSAVFYDDLMKVINGREGDDVIERFKEEYHEDVYIAIKNMLAFKPKSAKPEQAVRAPLDNSDFADQEKANIPIELGPQREKFKKGDVIGQKYEVFDVLGEGGFGIVYLVYSHETKNAYALKTFKDEFLNDIKTRERFRKEAQVWIDLERHPYIVRAHFVDEISGRLYIAMEHIASDEPGMNTLDGYLRNRPPDLAQTFKWAIQFCYGMEHAYSKGVKAHRDIKPANIMIDQNKNVKISDFGLAGVLPQSSPAECCNVSYKAGSGSMQTVVGTSIGTPEYMSPEQFGICQ